ncbi:MAG: SctU family type III secretion system export apparatus subunit CdsU [Chlamydiales bacterium]
MGEKTEKATPKKLRDARKKGQVAKSQDLPSAFTFIVSVSTVLALSNYLYQKLSAFLTGAFSAIDKGNLDAIVSSFFYEATVLIFTTSMPILLVVTLVGMLVNFLAVGPVFATEVFKPDIKKFDPVQNIKAKFKLKTLIELLKSIFKITVASYLIYTVVYKSIPVLIKTVGLPILGSLYVLYAFLIEVVLKVGLLFIVVAIADFVFQKKNFAKEMMMEKFEVKQEYKNTEGDPQIKSRRRQTAQEIAYSEGPVGGVSRAKAVVTNPTHLAIALGYDRNIDPAPYVLAKGSDELAKRIIKIAENKNIPIMRNVTLAHDLWENGELNEYVPEETYEAIAEILRWIASLEEGIEQPYYEVES